MISSEEIKKLGLLARIEISAREEKELQKELEAILSYVSKLKEAPPSPRLRRASPSGAEKEISDDFDGDAPKILNVFRKDEPLEDKSEIKKGEYIKVRYIL